jgi:hypothetical protein
MRCGTLTSAKVHARLHMIAPDGLEVYLDVHLGRKGWIRRREGTGHKKG